MAPGSGSLGVSGGQLAGMKSFVQRGAKSERGFFFGEFVVAWLDVFLEGEIRRLMWRGFLRGGRRAHGCKRGCGSQKFAPRHLDFSTIFSV